MAPGEQDKKRNGDSEPASSTTVAEQAAGEVNLDMPLAAQQDRDRQVPRSDEGEGSTGDSANVASSGQSATVAPKQGE